MHYVEMLRAFSDVVRTFIEQGGYFLILSFTLVEGIPLLGMAVPGHVAIVAGGFLARIGSLDLVWVLFFSLVGALLGDMIGFLIGRKYGMGFIERLRPYFFIKESHIEKACNLLSKHTGKALVIGRFTPVTRALMPFLVGTAKAPAGKFWFFNILGGSLWVASSVLVGYLFGSAYHTFSGYMGKTILITLILITLFVWGYKFVNLRFHIFRRYELFTLIINALSLFAFAVTVDKLMSVSFKLGFDAWVNIKMSLIADAYPFLVWVAYAVSTVGSVYVTGILGILFSLYFVLKKKWRSSAIMLLAVSSTAFFSGLIKIFFMSPRPENNFGIILSDPSFPSSHSSMAAALFMVLIYLLAPRISSLVKREIVIVVFVLLAVLIGLSRLILNVHWFSDIIGGWSLGLFMATSSILFIKYVSFLLIKKKQS